MIEEIREFVLNGESGHQELKLLLETSAESVDDGDWIMDFYIYMPSFYSVLMGEKILKKIYFHKMNIS